MRIYVLTALFICSFGSFAQNYIKGIVQDSTGIPLPYIAVALLNAADSSVYRGSSTDDKGVYEFQSVKKGNYLIKVSLIGYKDGFSDITPVDSISKIDIPQIKLNADGINLNEVSIAVQKKTVEFKGGNTIVTIDGSPLAVGNSAYDLLSQLPGVTVENGEISINGQPGVRILIDDRMQQLSGAQLVIFLKSIPGTTIDKIEVLKIPPVKYDSGGGSGLINIRTKKIKITGFSGSVYANASQGFYTHLGSGFSLNYKGKAISLFTGFNANRNPTQYKMVFERNVTKDSMTTHLSQFNLNKTTEKLHSYYLGADWFITKKNILGFKFENAPGSSDIDRHGQIKLQNSDVGYDLLPYFSDTHNEWQSNNTNLNFEHLFDTLGTKLTCVSDLHNNYRSYDGRNNNRFQDTKGNDVLPFFIYTNKNKAGVTIVSGKIDFEKKISKSLSFETGVKYSYQDMYSDFELQRKNYYTGIFETDTMFTNKFIYNEQIQAAYLNLAKQLKKINFSFGLRAENTVVNAKSVSKGTQFKRTYLGFFPLVSLDYNRSDVHSFSISYNRRLERPPYDAFNPYRAFFSNILVSGQGNPYLKPQFHNSFSLSHTFKSKVTHSFSYSLIENTMMGYSYQNDVTNELIWKRGNLKNSNHYSYTIYGSVDVKKWYAVNFNAGLFAFNYNGVLNDQPLKTGSYSYAAWALHRFTLPKDYKLELTTYVIGPWLGVIFNTKARSCINIGLTRTFFKNKLEITISAEDLFYTMPVNTSVNHQNLNFYQSESEDTRRFNLGLTYNFGKIKVSQREKQSSEEEKNRIKK